jgi:hypothetical protein
MGLDQYAFVVSSNGSKEEIAYWRKNYNLQGWMGSLWEEKGCPGLTKNDNENILDDFNCIPLELTYDDLADLEDAIYTDTAGFFFGGDSDNHYNLEFIKKAREALDNGLTVVYDSWW